jgi:hypothetical protein
MAKHLFFSISLAVGLLMVGCAGDEQRGDALPGDPCRGTIDCTPGSICFHEVCVSDGTLRFSLAWTENVDLDIHVETPNGSHIYYGNRSADGGNLDVDDCVGGGCNNPEGTHVENVFFDESAEPGTYVYWAHYFGGGSAAADYELVVAVDGNEQRSMGGTLSSPGDESERYEFTF